MIQKRPSRHDPNGNGAPDEAARVRAAEEDLGFGARVTEQSRLRLLNRDGSFNVERTGLSFFESLDLYHSLLTMSWSRFYAVTFATYIVINVLFAFGFMALGDGALGGIEETTFMGRFLEEFFFSVQTFTTVGYGHVFPDSRGANFLVVINAFVGSLGFALSTGLLFARFSRPTAKISFSRDALIAPYRDIRAFEFRIANQRRSQLIDVEARVLLVLNETVDGVSKRRFHNLALERDRVAFFPLSWTVVHPIDESSPLFGITEESMRTCDAEFTVLLTATDDVFSQMVHARTSYKGDEVVWGAKFTDPFVPSSDGVLRVDLRRLDEYQRVVDAAD
jgi:inward rectifier potassium channel